MLERYNMVIYIVVHDYEEEINGGEYSTWHNGELEDVFLTEDAAKEFLASKPAYQETDHYRITAWDCTENG